MAHWTPPHTHPNPPPHQDGGAADRYLWEFTGESRRWINGHPGEGGGGINLGGLKPQEMLRLRCSGGVRWMSEVEEEKEGEEMEVNEEIHQMWL